jgi:hypothetical protein
MAPKRGAMPENQRYELNKPPVVAEMVEGEAIAINLKTGRYHSLRGLSAVVWNCLLAGHTPGEILGAAGGAPGGGEASLGQFVDRLVAEGLIRPSIEAAPREKLQKLESWASGGLAMESFDDMQDMLTLDPIHETDKEYGWPRPAD